MLPLHTKDLLLLVFQITACFCYLQKHNFTQESQLKDLELPAVPIFAFPSGLPPELKPFVLHWQ